MKALIITLIILAVGVWLGIMLHHDSGYVLISYQHWSLETSLWVAAAALVLLIIALYYTAKFITWLLNLSGRYQQWSGHHKANKAQKLTQSGLCLLAEGNWKKAENTLIKAATNQPAPLINYLASARAAQEQHNFQKRDEYLKIAFDTSKDEEIAIGLTQAQLQIAGKQWEQAIATLQHLNTLKPNHKYVLKCLQLVYNRVEDWTSLNELLPILKKQKVLSLQKYQALEKSVALALLSQFNPDQSSADQLNDLWRSIDKKLQADADCLEQYIPHLLALGEDKDAYRIITQSIKISWRSSLLAFFPEMKNIATEQMFKQCELWHKQHPKNTALLLVLGQLCQQLQLWGKAKDYLNDCIALHPTPAAYLHLGQVFEAVGDKESALVNYKEGLGATQAKT